MPNPGFGDLYMVISFNFQNRLCGACTIILILQTRKVEAQRFVQGHTETNKGLLREALMGRMNLE